MQTIINKGREYAGLETTEQKYDHLVIYTNTNLLVYTNKFQLLLPKFQYDSNNSSIKYNANILTKENADSILRIVDYNLRLKNQNNKLKKYYCKIMRDYYYFKVTEQGIDLKKLDSFWHDGDYFEPQFIDINEFLSQPQPYVSHKKMAIKKLRP